MKSIKTGSLFRLAALLMIALIVVCMVGFAAESFGDKPKDPEQNEGNPEKKPDENLEDPIPEPPKPPEYVHYLTGLEITADESKNKPLCFVLDASSPLYGIYGSALTVEIPIENGQSRFLLYHENVKALGKIGSITATRDCITHLTDCFGGIAVHKGTDGKITPLGTNQGASTFDLSKTPGYAYTENTSFLYSNGDLLLAGLQNAGMSTALTSSPTPFHFHTYGSDPIRFSTAASNIVLPYASNNETGLYYDAETHTYLLGKGGQVKSDLLNGKNAAYTNAFVLFANTTTYESESHTEMIPDTASGGKGYYFTEGTATAIEWSTDEKGQLILKNEQGEVLTVNRGASYIAFYKASQSGSVVFS